MSFFFSKMESRFPRCRHRFPKPPNPAHNEGAFLLLEACRFSIDYLFLFGPSPLPRLRFFCRKDRGASGRRLFFSWPSFVFFLPCLCAKSFPKKRDPSVSRGDRGNFQERFRGRFPKGYLGMTFFLMFPVPQRIDAVLTPVFLGKHGPAYRFFENEPYSPALAYETEVLRYKKKATVSSRLMPYLRIFGWFCI